MQKVSVIIPAYNESKTIKETIEAVHAIRLIDEIIVVDDGSNDNTCEIARKCNAKVIRCAENKGKGNALKLGLLRCKGDIVVFLDADTEKTAREIVKLIQPIQDGICDVAIARFGRPKKKGGFGLVKLVSRYGTKLLAGEYIESTLSGQRAFKAEVLKNITIGTGYGAEVGMTIDIIKKGYTILECDVDMTHKETGRNLKGFLHRGKQMNDILGVLIRKAFERTGKNKN
jgi:glycosyltransferase involved in cell wall biosynthesis